MVFKIKDKRSQKGKSLESYVNRMNPKTFAALADKFVFPAVKVPNFLVVTLTDNEVVVSKVFVGGYNDFHATSTKFTDFDVVGDFAEAIKPNYENVKLKLFGDDYKYIAKMHNAFKAKGAEK